MTAIYLKDYCRSLEPKLVKIRTVLDNTFDDNDDEIKKIDVLLFLIGNIDSVGYDPNLFKYIKRQHEYYSNIKL